MYGKVYFSVCDMLILSASFYQSACINISNYTHCIGIVSYRAKFTTLKNSFDIIKQIQTPRLTLHPEFNCFLTFLGLRLFHLY